MPRGKYISIYLLVFGWNYKMVLFSLAVQFLIHGAQNRDRIHLLFWFRLVFDLGCFQDVGRLLFSARMSELLITLL